MSEALERGGPPVTSSQARPGTDNGAPTAGEMLEDPKVKREIERAWKDTHPFDLKRAREQGGWIYRDTETGELFVMRARAGGPTSIDLSSPPSMEDAMVVGKFHTHPAFPDAIPGPGPKDLATAERDGVPAIIRQKTGYFTYGPLRRLGGMAGPPGYPIVDR